VDVVEVHSPATEWAADLSADGKELYFASNRGGNFDIYVATRATATGPFSAPVVVTNLSSPQDDYGPELTPDGLTIYIASERGPSRDIYAATRSDLTGAWGTPVLVPAVSSSGTDDAPSITADGLVLVLRSDRAGTLGLSDVYMSERASLADAFPTPQRVANVNSTSDDEGTAISPDGLAIMFGSMRAGGQGSYDLWLATRTDRTAAFGAPHVVTELSSAAADDDADFSIDGATVLFSSNRSGSLGDQDLWLATRSCL
jgi:Tol biopolymer transport system component